MNNKPFEYTSRNGTKFTCEKCDFSKPIKLTRNDLSSYYPFSLNNTTDLMKDLAEMIGYHATLIRPELNGFAGYDCIEFQFGVD